MTKEEKSVKGAAYREAHKEEISVRNAAYREAHKEEIVVKNAAYREAHKEEIVVKKAAYYEAHKEEISVRGAAYLQTPAGKRNHKKNHAKRRSLDCIELNEPFEGSEGHHIDKEFVLHIPADLHHSIAHNVFTGYHMEEINELAINYAYGVEL